MCGIIGKISNTGNPPLRDAVKLLYHRGPDDNGYVCVDTFGKKVEFGHTRLSILDLSSSGSQPMGSQDNRWLISYNGEIYNHEKLRKFLDVPFHGHSDTETLIESIAAMGIYKTLPTLNGMFGFALLDKKKGHIYLVRDPFGIKPVYYSYQRGELSFSSEIRSLSAINSIDKTIDTNSVQKFLTLRYIPSPDTLFKGIKRLQPGHILCYDIQNDTIDISCYIKPVSEKFSGTMDDAVQAYTDALRLAVNSQMLSDVPVGILLSGGIDSSLIAAMAMETGKKLPGFTVGFGEQYHDCEIKDAAHTANILGMDHHFVEINSEDLWSVFSDVIRSVEEPLGTTSILAMWHLVKKARENVTVVLTGQGNDEPWGGYRRYQAEIWRRYLSFPLLFKGLSNLPFLMNFLPDFAERAIRSLSRNRIDDRFLEAYSLFTPTERFSLTGNPNDGLAINDIQKWLKWIGACKSNPVEKMMGIDSRMNLADDLLLYSDKTSMAFSLEARVPMLDIDLIKLVESFPVNYKIGFSKTKIVHRMAAAKYLPKDIISRPKKGFQIPFAQWAKGKWQDRIEAELFDKNAPYLSILRYDGVRKIWQDHLSGKRDCTRQLFALLSFAFCIKNQGVLKR